MKNLTCCFTGHRDLPLDEIENISRRLDEIISELVKRGVIYYGVGGALGFDTLASWAVLRARQRNPAVKLIMVLPCCNQHEHWAEKDKQTYCTVLSAADKIVCLSDHYYDGCMKKRNLHLVQHSGICVAYVEDEKSGGGQTVRLAREHGLTVINLTESDTKT